MDYVEEGTLSEEEEEKIRVFGKLAESLIVLTWIFTGFFAAVSLGVSAHLTVRFIRRFVRSPKIKDQDTPNHINGKLMGATKVAVVPIEDDSVFVIKKQGQGEEGESGRTQSAQSIESRVSRLSLEQDLEPLAEINQVFIKQLNRQTGKLQPAKVPKKYEVLTNYGERLFLATETTDSLKTRQYLDDRPFKFSVLNNHRESILQMDGDTNVINIMKEEQELGRILQTNRFSYICNLPPRYKIQDASGTTLYVLSQRKKGRCGDFAISKEFLLISPIENLCVGKVMRQNIPVAPDIYTPSESFSLSFFTDTMDDRDKALVIACVIVLDFQYFCKRRSYGFWKRLIVCIMVIGILIAVIVLVVNFAVEFNEGRKHRFPGNIINN